MKIYWLLAWDDYYPLGGLNNVHSRYETYEEAYENLLKIKVKYDNVRIEDISRLLNDDTKLISAQEDE